MDVNKNSYTIGFATFMVIIVAALLSSAAIGLKPLQSKNIEQEKKQNILKSVGIGSTTIYVDNVRPGFNPINESQLSVAFQNKVSLFDYNAPVGAAATANVSIAGTISSIVL